MRPITTEEVSRMLAGHDHGVAVVIQGGLTGLVHGADASAAEVILSMERMGAIARSLELSVPAKARKRAHKAGEFAAI